MASTYDAAAIEVLSGLDPVRKRPGMYTDTTRPNHLAQEVIDNSVDEAIAGHASRIDVKLYKDGSLEVRDDGRGFDTSGRGGVGRHSSYWRNIRLAGRPCCRSGDRAFSGPAVLCRKRQYLIEGMLDVRVGYRRTHRPR